MIRDSIKHQLNRGIYTDGANYSFDIMTIVKGLPKFSFSVDMLNPKFKPGQYTAPFNEIRFADFKQFVPDKYKSILLRKEHIPGSYNDFLQLLKKTLENVILNRMNETDKYIFFHSAGYDSRIISAAMAQVRDSGKLSMRNVHFRCHQPECEGFYKIMEAEGWPKDQYSCWEGPAEDYYDIGRSDVCVQGWVPFNQQMNFWSDMISKDQERDWICIAGLGGEMYKYWAAKIKPVFHECANPLLNLLIDHYPHHGQWENQWALRFKDILLPMWDYDYLYNLSHVNLKYLTSVGRDGGDNIRVDLCKLYPYSFQSVPHGEHGYSWNISAKRRKEIQDLFYGGTFYKHYGKHIPAKINFAEKLYGWEAKLWSVAVTIYDKLI